MQIRTTQTNPFTYHRAYGTVIFSSLVNHSNRTSRFGYYETGILSSSLSLRLIITAGSQPGVSLKISAPAYTWITAEVLKALQFPEAADLDYPKDLLMDTAIDISQSLPEEAAPLMPGQTHTRYVTWAQSGSPTAQRSDDIPTNGVVSLGDNLINISLAIGCYLHLHPADALYVIKQGVNLLTLSDVETLARLTEVLEEMG